MEQGLMPPTGEPQQRRGFSWSDFFNFRYMVTPVVIRVVYIIGAALITLGGLASMLSNGGSFFFGGGLISGLFFLLFGNIYWRVILEVVMVLFGIHDGIRSIERKS